MERTYWHRQKPNEPLYPGLSWSRPQNRQTAGKLLVIGGNVHTFAAVGESYSVAVAAGIGTVRVILPDALQKTIGKVFAAGEFAPSTPSGSFAKQALAPILDAALWADAILIAGDLGRNAETAILLETLLQKTTLPITLTQDAVDYVTSTPTTGKNRANTTLALSLSQLQRLAIATKHPEAITYGMDMIRLTEWLHDYTKAYQPFIITEHNETMIVAVNGEVSTTRAAENTPIWRVRTAARASVWWLQNPQKPFEALTTAMLGEDDH
jgi:NAD(P)H-hydrate repair Nnr-like enzyme with NAD(P)H-hydrate dehydratase domain